MVKKRKQPCYIAGDYNIDILKSDSHSKTADFLNLMYSNGFIPLINLPTRVYKDTHRESATIIDNIFTNNYHVGNKLHQGILTSDISDHYIVFHIWQMDSFNKDREDQYQLIRQMSRNNIDKYVHEIENCDWSTVITDGNCQSLVFHFFQNHEKDI